MAETTTRIQDPLMYAGFSADEGFINFIEKYEDRKHLPADLEFYDFGSGYISIPEPTSTVYAQSKEPLIDRPPFPDGFTGRMISALVRNDGESTPPDFLCFSYFPNSLNFGINVMGAVGNFNVLSQKLTTKAVVRHWDIYFDYTPSESKEISAEDIPNPLISTPSPETMAVLRECAKSGQ
jgi:hypothetical protein